MYDYSDTCDSDEEFMGHRKALAVEIPHDFNPNKIPENGEEYLQLVMYEATKCKQLVSVHLDASKVKKQTYEIRLNKECIKAPKTMIPTMQWQNEKVSDFTKFCKFIQTKITKEPTEATIHETIWIQIIRDQSPTFTLVTNLTQSSKIKLLRIIIDELAEIKSGETIEYNTGLWLYSILATLEIPLCPNSCYCLRELARKCSIIRSELADNCNEDAYVTLNLLICLVARFFKQFDLADNEKDVIL